MTKRTVKKPGDPGFSLVEILIVLSLASVLAATAIPIVTSSLRDMQLAADAQNISSALSAARLKAKSTMTPYRISLDLGNNRWSLEKFNSNTGQFELEQDVNQLSSGLAGSGIRFMAKSESHPGIFPSESSGTITFNTRGIPVDINNRPTSDNIVYISRPGSDYAISATLTGKVQVWKNKEGRWQAQ